MLIEQRPTEKDAAVPLSRTNPLFVNVVRDVDTQFWNGRTAQIVVGTSATLIAPANAYRRSILIVQITGTQIVYLGFDTGVSALIGHYLGAVTGNNITLSINSAIWGIAASSGQTVSIIEEWVAP